MLINPSVCDFPMIVNPPFLSGWTLTKPAPVVCASKGAFATHARVESSMKVASSAIWKLGIIPEVNSWPENGLRAQNQIYRRGVVITGIIAVCETTKCNYRVDLFRFNAVVCNMIVIFMSLRCLINCTIPNPNNS